jgi:predicted transcriptional regulator
MATITEQRLHRTHIAQTLRAKGLTHLQIAKIMGISRSYASILVTDPDGSKEAARKRSYAGICKYCGAATDGSNGRNKAPECCKHCAAKRAPRKWTQELVIEKIQEWTHLHGKPPKATDWLHLVEGSPGQYVQGSRDEIWSKRRWPSVGSVQNRFGSWANAVEAAGFPRPLVGHYQRTTKTREKRRRISRDRVHELIQQGCSDMEIADLLDCHSRTITKIRTVEFDIKRKNSLLAELYEQQQREKLR